MMGPKTFEQCAGFLRISGAENPLDNSSVHPERYGLIEQMAKDLQASLEDLIRQSAIRKKIDPSRYISETVGAFTIADILKELEKPGRDPRAPIAEFRFEESIRSMEDLKPGMRVPGLVTNITNFGAFVDVGVRQDGLVHISHLSNRYISDPNEAVKLNQKVMVTVLEVDAARKRIALSMKEGGGERSEARGQGPEVRSSKPVKIKEGALNPFQAKLMELKKNFKD